MFRQWMRFNAVGVAGIFVQLAALHVFHNWLGCNYLMATALAVETAVLHNFWWYWKWTWRERKADASSLIRFQCTTGFVSILGNLGAMKVLAGMCALPVLWANAGSIVVCYLFNYLVSDRYVFRLR